ncbi:MAG: hypothetical protein ACKVS9_04680 [Phycisphaerae bacterium]
MANCKLEYSLEFPVVKTTRLAVDCGCGAPIVTFAFIVSPIFGGA